MRQQLFILFGDGDRGHLSWLRLDGERDQLAQPESGTVEELAELASGRRVIALLPATDVLVSKAFVPGRNRQRIASAIPFALEDQLVNDVEGLHFAMGERDEDGQIHVAVVDRQRMDESLERLQQVGIQPDVVTSAVLAVPYEVGNWTALRSGDNVLIRTDLYSGFAVDIDNLSLMLTAALKEAGETLPLQIKVLDCGGGKSLPDLSALGVEVNVETCQQALLGVLADGYDKKGVINLLQGAYSRREQLSKVWRPWRPAAVMLLVWMVLHIGMTITDYFRLSGEQDLLKTQIEQVVQQAFPGIPNIHKASDPKKLVEQQLKALRGDKGEGAEFLSLLGEAGASFKATQGLQLRRLRYKEGELDVALEIGDLAALDQLKQRLAKQGSLAVEIQSASSSGNKVEARLMIKEAAS